MKNEFELEDIFDRAEAEERRARVQAARELNAARDAQEAAQAEARRQKATAYTMMVNERHRRAEYRGRGVEPPMIGGVQTRASLSLLLSVGWRIEQQMGRNVLVPPISYQSAIGQGVRYGEDHNT